MSGCSAKCRSPPRRCCRVGREGPRAGGAGRARVVRGTGRRHASAGAQGSAARGPARRLAHPRAQIRRRGAHHKEYESKHCRRTHAAVRSPTAVARKMLPWRAKAQSCGCAHCRRSWAHAQGTPQEAGAAGGERGAAACAAGGVRAAPDEGNMRNTLHMVRTAGANVAAAATTAAATSRSQPLGAAHGCHAHPERCALTSRQE